MQIENISKISIDQDGRLIIMPEKETFEYIYRSASETNWNNENKYLFSQIPREWSIIKWFNHMIQIVISEYHITLEINKNTIFENINEELEIELEKELKRIINNKI